MHEPSQDHTRKLRVFLCHASVDKKAVRRLHQRLVQDGMAPWLDEKDLLPGQNWRHEIPKVVGSSDVVLICLSRSSITKEGYVQKEIKFALDAADEKPQGTIFLIPVKLEECEVPERLGRVHWTDLFKRGGYNQLKGALRTRAQQLQVPLPEVSIPRRPRESPPTPRGSKNAAVRPTPALVQPLELAAGTLRENPEDQLDYVWIPAGTFQMGATPGDSDARDGEKPRHRVEITKGFWTSSTAVTVKAYKRFVEATVRAMPQAPNFDPNWEKEDHPIVKVNWHDAKAYCEWAGGRLPTEAEWEYAARGGEEGLRYPWGNKISSQNAKYNSKDGTAPVGSNAANGFGLYDMAGNVWEWCSDWYEEVYYASSPAQDPQGPPEGTVRVFRGGSWGGLSRILRCSYRGRGEPGLRYINIGFRCVREVLP